MEFLLLIFLVFLITIAILWSRRSEEQKDAEAPHWASLLYRVRGSVLNSSEKAFFLELQKQLPESHYAFPKMRIADIIKTLDGRGYYKARNMILPKHVDFLVCDSRFRPVMAIEIDGKSHRSSRVIERDEMVNEIFKGIGLKLERVLVGSDFSTETKSLFSDLNI
jgi:hypothetical protein